MWGQSLISVKLEEFQEETRCYQQVLKQERKVAEALSLQASCEPMSAASLAWEADSVSIDGSGWFRVRRPGLSLTLLLLTLDIPSRARAVLLLGFYPLALITQDVRSEGSVSQVDC